MLDNSLEWNPHDLRFEHIHLEISSKCALKCPRCPRTEHPDTPWLNKQLSYEQVVKILPQEILANHVKRITVCGDVGDAIYNSDFHKIISYIKSTNPKIHIYLITNGSHRKREWWAKLAGLLNNRDTIAFSIDGFDQNSNNHYRVGSDWDSIMAGIDEIRQSEAFIVWATIVFKFNEKHLDEIAAMARAKGCDILQLTKSTKFGSVYKRFKDADEIDRLEPKSEWISKTLRFERTNHFLSDRIIDNDEFMNFMRSQTNKYEESNHTGAILPLCKTGNRGLYINVTGQIFPCSWVIYPHKFIQSNVTGRKVTFEESFFKRFADRFNILTRDFYKVIADPLWDKIFNSHSDQNKCFIECEHKCSKHVMDEKYKIDWFLN